MLRFIALCALATSLSAAGLTGTVVTDHDGTPVVAAAVTLRQGNKVFAELETDDKGQFSAPALAAGQYTVEVKKSSYVSLERRVTQKDADQNLGLRLIRQGVVTGTVLDSMGKGVRNAVVAAIPVPADGSRPTPGRGAGNGAATDTRGVYRIHGLAPGSYIIAMAIGQPRDSIAQVRGLLPDTSLGNNVQIYPGGPQPQTFTVRSGEEFNNINFSVYRGPLFSIKGTVSGAPGANYRVMLQNMDARSVQLASATAQQGKGFEFTHVPPGNYRIVALSQQSYLVELPANFSIPADAQGISIVEVRPGVRAAIVSGDSAPNVPPDQGFVVRPNSTASEPSFGETQVVVAGQDAVDVTIPVFRGVAPTIVYQPAAGCDANAQLILNPLEDWGTGNTNRPVSAGKEITLPALPPAPFSVNLNGPAGRNCFAQPAEIDFRQASAGVAIPVTALPFGSIQGKLKTARLPVEEYELALTSPTAAPVQWLAPDAAALFAFKQLRPGKYRISVYRASGDRSAPVASQEIDVSSGSQLELEFPEIP